MTCASPASRVAAELDAAAGVDLRDAEVDQPRGAAPAGSRAVKIRPVYGTESRRMATSRLKSRVADQVRVVEMHACWPAAAAGS